MNDNAFINYLNELILSEREFNILTDINNKILIKSHNDINQLKNAINYVEDNVNRYYGNIRERDQDVINNYFRKVRKYVLNRDFKHDIRCYYEEFEL